MTAPSITSWSARTALAGSMLAGCLAPVIAPEAVTGGTPVPVWIVTHGWHAGIAFRLADLPAHPAPVRRDFPGAESLEIGWGNREFWMAPDPTLGQALRAGFLPSTSAIRVIAFRGPIGGVFVESDVLELAVSRAGLERLADYVDAGFARDGAALIPIGPGPIPASRYYLARGRYHALNNSNAWTARALRAAGVPIHPVLALTAANVLCQAGPLARIIRLRPDTVVSAERGCCRAATG